MSRGGNRPGAGRRPSLSIDQRLLAGRLCDQLLHEQSIERAFVLLYGEDGAQEIGAANDALRAARSRVEKHAAQQDLAETLESAAFDVQGRPCRYVTIGSGRGRRAKRTQGDQELLRKDIIEAVADLLSHNLGRPVSSRSIDRAWKFARAVNADKASALVELGGAMLTLSENTSVDGDVFPSLDEQNQILDEL